MRESGQKGLPEEVTFKLRPEGKESSRATHLGQSVPGRGNRLDGGPEAGRGLPCPRNSERAIRTGTQGRWGVLQKETEAAGGGQAGPTERSYSTFKVRRGGSEEIHLIQGKEQRLHSAGVAVKRYPTSKIRETQIRR